MSLQNLREANIELDAMDENLSVHKDGDPIKTIVLAAPLLIKILEFIRSFRPKKKNIGLNRIIAALEAIQIISIIK